MRKVKILLACFLAVMLACCTNNDEPTPAPLPAEETMPEENVRYLYNISIKCWDTYYAYGWVTWVYGWNIIVPVDKDGGRFEIWNNENPIDHISYVKNGKKITKSFPSVGDEVMIEDFMKIKVVDDRMFEAIVDPSSELKNEIGNIKIWSRATPISERENGVEITNRRLNPEAEWKYPQPELIPLYFDVGAWKDGGTDYSIPGI